MSMAYLMGSAYLEWLEQRSGPDSLRNLWSRMTARHRRSFDEAFIGVFGERPDRLYGQFVAELTASAMTIDRDGAAGRRAVPGDDARERRSRGLAGRHADRGRDPSRATSRRSS